MNDFRFDSRTTARHAPRTKGSSTRRPLLLALIALALFASERAFSSPRYLSQTTVGEEIGVGMVRPTIDPETPLLFYRSPSLGSQPTLVAPSDSLTFQAGPHSLEIGYAPPWYLPSSGISKLDYDLLILRAVSLSRNWIEVLVNDSAELPRSFPRTVWVSREAVEFQSWEEFLLDISSVRVLAPERNPLRAGPGEDYPETDPSPGELRILSIEGRWARVEGYDGKEQNLPKGWIRWRGDGRLLISYSLFS